MDDDAFLLQESFLIFGGKLRTAEAVSRGHVDKVCDQISDAILDEYLKLDPNSRVAVETAGGHGCVYVFGEVSSMFEVDLKAIASRVYRDIGYEDEVQVVSRLVRQSPDISLGVDKGGAGDQGVMIGYACNENEAMIPNELFIARDILSKLPSGYGPDAKSQVTLNEVGEIDTIVLSAQHDIKSDFAPLEELVSSYDPRRYFVNPTGAFVCAGFEADSGLTGRKIVQDAYGPRVAVGGGAFSGKDGTKVDRSAAYMARKIAIDCLRKYGAGEVTAKIAYSIGVADPVMAEIAIDDKIEKIVGYDLRPQAIMEQLKLSEPVFYQTAQSGHFGHGFSWDR